MTLNGVALADLNDGLSAFYLLDGDAFDASGNGHNGLAFGGITYEEGIIDQAAKFDGSTDYIDLGIADDIIADNILTEWSYPHISPCKNHNYNHILPNFSQRRTIIEQTIR